MEKVTRLSDWGYWDKLGDEVLKEGERLRVQWPDGCVTEEVCKIDHRTFTISDMGHDSEGSDDRAYVERGVSGIKAPLFLRQEGILCERI